MRRSRMLSLATIAVASAVVLTGCTSAVQKAESPDGNSPTKGGILHIVQAADVQPATLFAQNNPNFSLTRTVFNSLIDYNHKDLKPEPELATSWKMSDDGKALTFQLRKGVTFHDGSAFTAADVIASLKAVQRPGVASQTKSVATAISDMQAPNDHEVVITFSQAMSNTMDLFLMTPIIKAAAIDDALAGKSFMGTGPFSVKQYSPGQGFTLERYDDYWKKGAPYLDGVQITVVRDSQSMLSQLKSGQADLAMDLAPLDAASLKDTSGYELELSDANDSVQYIASNVTVPLLSDKRVRQAISYAIDRKRILEQVDGGIGSVASLPWAESSPAYDKSLVDHFARDLAKSKQLLEEADAVGKSVNIYYDAGFQPNTGIAQIAQFDLTQVGLKPNLIPLQASDFLDKLRTGGFDGMFLTGHGFGQLNPATLVKGAFPFNADANASSFDNAEYKQLANELWLSNGVPSKATLDKMNSFLLDQQFVSDLVLSTHTFAISSKVKGLSETMLDYLDLDSTYIQK
ncbi:ABC transporter substrate-binding protein [Microbacterium sp. STN6]|uniref:ABC transporter substrate-binding protein n=1 Tax=Microbacterium sp. STN6 TaxID=2995588 RepID=UPI002260B173|nr:ABC transporter substrate-binding protein [Microbacterium sp. STN6]MCX7522584.1 ABC transporter substrate-binding protein [Microbacterium sp. STN6]